MDIYMFVRLSRGDRGYPVSASVSQSLSWRRCPSWTCRLGIYLKHLNQVESVPFVLGTSPSLPTTLVVAALIATANALNALSTLW